MADLAAVAAAAAAAGEVGGVVPDSQLSQQALVENLLHGDSQVEHYYAEDSSRPGTARQGTSAGAAVVAAAAALAGADASALAGVDASGALGFLESSGFTMLHAAAVGANLGANMFGYPHSLLPLESFPPPKHPSLQKPEHEDSKAKRRGPMDEMRQLVRIMVKFLPQSLKFLVTSEEPGGGNRVTEPQIKSYLKNTLGDEAPQPTWGMPNGWGAYLADLFSWALGREISDEDARSCACRQQGRSWQVKETRLAELGIFAYAWPLPLTQEGIARAQENPGDPPPGSNFIGPPPGWPNVELGASGGVAAMPRLASSSRQRGRASGVAGVLMDTGLRKSVLDGRPVSGEAGGQPELDCLQEMLQLALVAGRARSAAIDAGLPADLQATTLAEEICALLQATYPPTCSLAVAAIAAANAAGPAPAAATTSTDTPKVRASRALLEAQINSPAKPPTALLVPPGGMLLPVLAPSVAVARGRGTGKAAGMVMSGGGGGGHSLAMEHLVSAAMTHVKANGDLALGSDGGGGDCAGEDDKERPACPQAAGMGDDGGGSGGGGGKRKRSGSQDAGDGSETETDGEGGAAHAPRHRVGTPVQNARQGAAAGPNTPMAGGAGGGGESDLVKAAHRARVEAEASKASSAATAVVAAVAAAAAAATKKAGYAAMLAAAKAQMDLLSGGPKPALGAAVSPKAAAAAAEVSKARNALIEQMMWGGKGKEGEAEEGGEIQADAPIGEAAPVQDAAMA